MLLEEHLKKLGKRRLTPGEKGSEVVLGTESKPVSENHVAHHSEELRTIGHVAIPTPNTHTL